MMSLLPTTPIKPQSFNNRTLTPKNKKNRCLIFFYQQKNPKKNSKHIKNDSFPFPSFIQNLKYNIMHNPLLLIFSSFLFIKITITYGTTFTMDTTTASSITNFYQNFAYCSCDVMPTLCDNYCCCDTNCDTV